MNYRHCGILSSLLLISGCAYESFKHTVEDSYKKNETIVTQKSKDLVPAEVVPRPVLTHSPSKWIGSKSVPLAKDSNFPPVFSKPVTLIFPGRLSLRTVAERITKVTSIPVRLKPDVFMPTSMFIGSTGAPLVAVAPVQAMSPQAAQMPVIPYPLGPAGTYRPISNTVDEFELNYTGSLSGLLDQIGARFGINWEYTEATGISYSRLITKSFVIKANPGDSSFTSSLGKGGSAGGSFSSDSQVKMNSSFSVWDGIQKALDSIKSPVGKFHVSQATGSVTITDTKDVIDVAERIITSENEMLTKQVAIKLEMYSVTSTDDKEAGVDWNVVYTAFSNLAPQFSLNAVSPASLASAVTGNLGLSILAPVTGDNGLQNFNGSQALLKALEGQGKVSRMQRVSAMTLNRQPVPIGVTEQIAYLARTTPTSGGAGGSSSPGLEPGQVTTGFLVNILPTVLDSNSVLLQFSIDLTELKRIGIISTGFGTTLQSIQTPEVSGTQFVQRVALKAGSTLVLSGFERTRDDYTQRGINDTVGLGGAFVGKKTRESIVIMLTPVLVDGAS